MGALALKWTGPLKGNRNQMHCLVAMHNVLLKKAWLSKKS